MIRCSLFRDRDTALLSITLLALGLYTSFEDWHLERRQELGMGQIITFGFSTALGCNIVRFGRLLK